MTIFEKLFSISVRILMPPIPGAHMDVDLSDILPADARRLALVEKAHFVVRKLFKSVGESLAFHAAREICGEKFLPDFFIMAQVSFCELFEPRMLDEPSKKNDQVSKLINAMRCDMAIFCPFGRTKLIVEVHGDGHFGSEDHPDYFAVRSRILANDAIKRHVCRVCNVPILEITGNELISEIRRQIALKLFGPHSGHPILKPFDLHDVRDVAV